MEVRCVNPDCNRAFRELNKGRLFLLPPPQEEPELTWKVEKLVDHSYWLCPDCAKTYIVILDGTEPVIRRAGPGFAGKASAA